MLSCIAWKISTGCEQNIKHNSSLKLVLEFQIKETNKASSPDFWNEVISNEQERKGETAKTQWKKHIQIPTNGKKKKLIRTSTA